VCYLSGLENAYMVAFHALFVPAAGEPTVFASDFEMLNAGPDLWWRDRVTFAVGADPLEVVCTALPARGMNGGRLGIEAGLLSHAAHRQLEAGLPDTALVPADGLMAEVKQIKSPAEIRYLREAGRLSTLGMEAAAAAAAVGRTDNEIA